MIKVSQYFLLLFLLPFSLSGQMNLVPNPSFEQYTVCPDNGGQINYASFWSNPTPYASPDYFNSCGMFGYGTPNINFGYENGRTGNAYAGIVTYVGCPGNPPGCVNSREYIQVQLTDTLQSGVKYCVCFYVSLADSAQFSAGNIGAYFSNTMLVIPNDSVIPVVPQIYNDPLVNPLTNKNGWTMVMDSFIASGGETFLIIGNFNYDNSTVTQNVSGANWCNYSFYLIDDVLVTPCDSLNNINDIHDVGLIQMYPNPTSGIVEIKFSNTQEKYLIIITDSFGRQIIKREEANYPLTTKIDISEFSNGVYILEVVSDTNHLVKKIIKSN